ncbi:MAG: hypothetical protein KDD04_12505, partial [Sinomicrobium sp.]|nr:hypothetical protein [Sinomicrobium sp.]
NIKDRLSACLSTYNIGRMDTHNIFLQELLSNGIWGLAALLALFIMLFLNAVKKPLFISFLILILIFGMIEHLLDLQNGVVFLVFFMLLLRYTDDPEAKFFSGKGIQNTG